MRLPFFRFGFEEDADVERAAMARATVWAKEKLGEYRIRAALHDTGDFLTLAFGQEHCSTCVLK